jgi:NADH dehydrogenase
MKQIVVLGGGYGGLAAINQLLEGDLPKDATLILIDRMPYQGLKTEYYALASGSVADVDIRVSFPDDPRVQIKYGEITGIDMEEQMILLQHEDPVSYDWLFIALGCTDRHHGIPGADQFTNSIQTLSASRKAFQQINDVKPYGQVTIVGGGLSGVEFASELRESREDLNITILDRGSSILSAFPDKLQHYCRSWFEEHHVEMRNHISLTRVELGLLHNQKEEIITDVTLWTAGIQPSAIVQQLQLPKDSQGRILINEYHQVPSHPEVYVVGDCASLVFAPSAQAAEAQGRQAAQVLQAVWKGDTPKLQTIKLKGVLGSLGKRSGFGMMGKRTVMIGKVPRLLKSGVLWMSKRHSG